MKKLYFNKKAAEAEVKNRQQYIDKINELSEELRKEGVILTNDILSEFVSGGADSIRPILIQNTVEKFNKVGIPVDSTMLGGFNRSAGDVAAQLHEFYQPIQVAQIGARIGPDLVTLENGKAKLSEAEIKEIKERNTYYLKKDDEPLYSEISSFATVVNEMEKSLKEKTGLSLMDCLRTVLSENSFEVDDNHILHPRADVFLILSKDLLEVNPVFFEGRNSRSKDRLS